jgi:hypothetical protein
MSTCKKCGAESKGTAKYCKACGAGMASGALQEKKARVMARDKQWMKPSIIAAALIVVLAGAWIGKGIYRADRMGDHPVLAAVRDASATTVNAEFVKAQDGLVRIPASSVQDGQAHFFSYAAGSKTIRFFLMRAEDGSIKSALDACVACNHAKLGYRQQSGMVVCNNCGMAFKPADIGAVVDGCNPIPINKSMDGQMIVLKTSDLEDGVKYF